MSQLTERELLAKGSPAKAASQVDAGGQTKRLDVGHDRTCSCPENHMNCMTAKQWLKRQLAVWEFFYEGRDIRDKSVHPATFPISLAKAVIELFTHEGQLVIDPFVGSGTTLVGARDINRNAVGFDLHQKYIDLSLGRLVENNMFNNAQQLAICDDARNIPDWLAPETVSLILTSPPYANLLNRKRKNKSRRGDLRANEQLGKVEQYSQTPATWGRSF